LFEERKFEELCSKKVRRTLFKESSKNFVRRKFEELCSKKVRTSNRRSLFELWRGWRVRYSEYWATKTTTTIAIPSMKKVAACTMMLMVLRILIQDMVFGIQTGIKRSDWLSRPGNEHQKFNTVEIVFLLMALSTVLINLPVCLPSNVSSSLNRIGHCQPSICSCSTRCRIKKGVRVAK
jgi:hypothetical protein